MKAKKTLLILFSASVLVLSTVWIQTRAIAASEASKAGDAASAPPASKTKMSLPKRQVKITWAAGGESDVEIKEVVNVAGIEFWRIKSEDNQMELINPAQIQSLAW